MTDRDMLERFVTRRDEEAFEGLVLRHGPMVLGLCRRIVRDTHEAEDAFQATFLVLARNAPTIRNLDSIASWLYGVAYRIALRAKAGARRRAYEGQALAMAVHEPGGEFDRQDIRPIVHDEVGRLPEKYRAPVVLCFFEGQTHEEAAQQLACPTGTVKGRLARAKEMLRSRLERRGLAVPVALIALLLSDEATASVPEELVHATVGSALRDGHPAATANSAPRPSSGRVVAFALALAIVASLARLVVDRASARAGAVAEREPALRLSRPTAAPTATPDSCHERPD